MSACAAPPPLERIGHEACFDRVEGEVAAGGDELHVAADLAGHRMSAEEVRGASTAPVVVARVLGVEPLESY